MTTEHRPATASPPAGSPAPGDADLTPGESPLAEGTARQRLRSLVHLSRAISDPRPVDDLVEVAAHEIRFALDAAVVSVSRLERERGLVRVLRNVGNVGDLGPEQAFRPVDETYQIGEHPMLAALVEEAQAYTLDTLDPAADPAAVAVTNGTGKRYGLGAPLLVDGRVWGQLYATRAADAAPFTEDDVALIEALAAVTASGIGQASRVSLVERLAYEDPLTGLANRRAIDLRLEEALDARNAGGAPVSVVMADVNGLKRTNDELGHEAGDRVLVTVADAISHAVSQVPAGIAGRVGGDEFCVVLDGLDAQDAARLALSIIDRLEEGPSAGALSCGVASTSVVPPSQPVSSRQILRWADEAQYTAKRAGMQTPVIAGRDTLVVQPTERRSLRAAPPHGSARGDHVATSPGARGESAGSSTRQLLAVGLSALATAGDDPQLRLVRLLDAVSLTAGGLGWVLSRCDGGTSRTVAFAQSGELARPETAVQLTGSWFERAGLTGVVERHDGLSPSLADARGVPVVAAAAVDGWLVEILDGDDSLVPGTAAVLRALASVAACG